MKPIHELDKNELRRALIKEKAKELAFDETVAEEICKAYFGKELYFVAPDCDENEYQKLLENGFEPSEVKYNGSWSKTVGFFFMVFSTLEEASLYVGARGATKFLYAKMPTSWIGCCDSDLEFSTSSSEVCESLDIDMKEWEEVACSDTRDFICCLDGCMFDLEGFSFLAREECLPDDYVPIKLTEFKI